MAENQTEEDVLLPPKESLLVNTGIRIPVLLLEQLDWISAREKGYSRTDLILEACNRLIREYSRERGVEIGRIPFDPATAKRRGGKRKK